jgi:hypothetical protein
MSDNVTNSKEGREVYKDPAPGLPVVGGRIFGESPVKRPLTGRHPPTRSDASETENLKDASASSARVR